MVHAAADRNWKEILLNFPSSEGGQNSNPGQQISFKLDWCGPRYFGETGARTDKTRRIFGATENSLTVFSVNLFSVGEVIPATIKSCSFQVERKKRLRTLQVGWKKFNLVVDIVNSIQVRAVEMAKTVCTVATEQRGPGFDFRCPQLLLCNSNLNDNPVTYWKITYT